MSSRGNKTDRDKNEKIRQFREVTGSNENDARQRLQQNEWVMERAVASFFDDPGPSRTSSSSSSNPNAPSSSSSSSSSSSNSRFDRRKVEQIWSRLADPKEQSKLSIDQLLRLLNDLSLDPLSRETLILFWKMNASVQGELKKSEFMEGMEQTQCDSLDKLKERLKQLNRDVDTDNEKFKQLYLFTFNFGRSASNARNLDLNSAITYWRMLFSPATPSRNTQQRFKLFDLWLKFLDERGLQRPITKDIWDLLYEFASTVSEDLTNYDHDGAWPTMIDDFVEYAKASQTAGA